MSVVVVTPPEPDIDLDLVKAHLRVDHADDDVLIQAFIDAACGHIDGPAGWLGRSIWAQTLELRQDGLCGRVRLPYGPVTAITTVKTVDTNGVEQTMSSSDYLLTNGGDLVLAHGASWPSVRGDTEGVRIRYAAGFAALPGAILSAVLLMVGDLYSNRETVGEVTGAIQMSTTVANLLSPFRNWRV
ncbi:MAG: phage gp6-like head-tail connector protein [Brevundimonas sp.]|nr:MAG: phage gp6-like head-tail connector protein [Brevundimonas sp.]